MLHGEAGAVAHETCNWAFDRYFTPNLYKIVPASMAVKTLVQHPPLPTLSSAAWYSERTDQIPFLQLKRRNGATACQ